MDFKKKSINEILFDEIIHEIISIYLPEKITLSDVRYNNIKYTCHKWYNIYHLYFKKRGTKYAIIEKYNRYSLAPPVSHRFQVKPFKNFNNQYFYIKVYFNDDLWKRYFNDNDREIYYCGKNKIILADQLKDYGKSKCKKCGKLTYCLNFEFCLDHEFNYCSVLDCMMMMSFTHKNRTYTFHQHHLCKECKVHFLKYSYSSFE
jgi:hypothetical protein